MRHWIAYLAALALPLAACDKAVEDAPNSEAAKEAAGESTIAQGLGDDASRFAAATKAAGLDTTLAGPGPYTVLVPTDEAFGKLPAGALDNMMKPESRPQLTKVLTYHILSGAILAEDIAKAIENGAARPSLCRLGAARSPLPGRATRSSFPTVPAARPWSLRLTASTRTVSSTKSMRFLRPHKGADSSS
ncbi:hypothetical protein G7076_11830 [Sphingomonas sp. HDW15A]|uniref:fasciclin domain-containing protein n=1 Tax=Sphingomonas sp. HDW15A TaxID=2714942 RepID=UPI00140AB133|nr:fasciclin domain-containing protein [Sphingomonas sp. HDW15A]QIK97017.1 hypothetical protein G7076_11830 [Sphingomonas sp. HDW15A]